MKKGFILSMVFGLSLVAASACDCVKSCETHALKSCGCKNQGEKYSAAMKAIGISDALNSAHSCGKIVGDRSSSNKESRLKSLGDMVGIKGCKNSCNKTSTLSIEDGLSLTGSVLSKCCTEDSPILFTNAKKDTIIGNILVGAGNRAEITLVKKCVDSVCSKIKGYVFSKDDNLIGIHGESNSDGTFSVKSGAEVSLVIFEN